MQMYKVESLFPVLCTRQISVCLYVYLSFSICLLLCLTKVWLILQTGSLNLCVHLIAMSVVVKLVNCWKYDKVLLIFLLVKWNEIIKCLNKPTKLQSACFNVFDLNFYHKLEMTFRNHALVLFSKVLISWKRNVWYAIKLNIIWPHIFPKIWIQWLNRKM